MMCSRSLASTLPVLLLLASACAFAPEPRLSIPVSPADPAETVADGQPDGSGGPPTACTPVEQLAEGSYAGDSASLGGRRVARDAASIRESAPLRLDGPAFRPGERIVVVLDGAQLGTAVYDGCKLVAEWATDWKLRGVQRVSVLSIATSRERYPFAAGHQVLEFSTRAEK